MNRVAELWFARLAVERGLITPTQAETLAAESEAAGPPSLADRLVARGWLTREQCARLQAEMGEAAAAGTLIQGIGDAPEPPDAGASTTAPAAGAALPAGSASAPRRDDAAATTPGTPEAPARLQPSLFGKYQIVEELGRGAMGVVYRAVDTELRREVALKTVLLGAEGDAERTQRFLREARTAATLDHPGIVPIHDMGVVDGIPFFAMGLIRGRTLDEVFASGAAPELDARIRLVAAAARAVAHAHERRVIHRDLKPANIVLDPDGAPHVMDFGLAKQMDEGARLTAEGEVLGTPMYMAPEQMGGLAHRVGPTADVYSLGAILYEAITGRAPFSGGTLAELMNKVINAEPEAPRSLRRGISVDLETVVLKALDKSPERRYPDAAALADDLDRVLREEPILARPVSRSTRILRRALKNRAVVAPSLALAVLGIALILQAWSTAVRRAKERAAHLAEAIAHRANGRSDAARDAYRAALQIDPDHAGARAGVAWAEEDLARIERQRQEEIARVEAAAAAAQRALRKAGQVQAVLARWVLLGDALAELERGFGDANLNESTRRERAAGPWERVEAFLKATPDDPVSQATARAFSGWAWRWAGRAEEGLAWIREAASLDPELPYGPLLEAMISFEEYLSRQPVQSITAGGEEGLKFWRSPMETPEMAVWRERMETRLADAERAAVWGGQVAEEFRGLVAALRSLREGEYAETHRCLTGAVDAASLRIFRTPLLFARAKVRCLLGRWEDGLADAEEALAARPGNQHLLIYAHLLSLGLAVRVAADGRDAVPLLEKARAFVLELLRIEPESAWTQTQRGIGATQLGDARGRVGEDPRACYEEAIAAYGEAMRLDPDRPHHYYNRALTLLKLADRDDQAGLDPRETIRRAIADHDVAVGTYPQYGHHWIGRSSAHEALGDADAARGANPLPAYERAVADLEGALERHHGSFRPGALFRIVPMRLKLAFAREQHGGDPAPDLERARACAEEGVTLLPDAAEGRLALARACEALARWAQMREGDAQWWSERALAEYGAAIERAPRMWQTWASRAQAHERRGRWAEAAGDWERAVDCQPGQEALREALTHARGRAVATASPATAGRLAALDAAAERVASGDYAAAHDLYEGNLAAAAAALGSDPALAPLLRSAHYNFACILALRAAGRPAPESASGPVAEEEARRGRDQAFHHLGAAIDLGFRDAGHLETDEDLRPLHDDPRWAGLLERMR